MENADIELETLVRDAVDTALAEQRVPATLRFWGTRSQCAYIGQALLSYCHLHGLAADIVPTGGGFFRKFYLLRAELTPAEGAALEDYFQSLLLSFH